MTEYHALKHVDWQALHGKTLRIEVSEHYIIGVFKDGSFQILLKAKQSRKARKAEPSTGPRPEAQLPPGEATEAGIAALIDELEGTWRA